MSHKLGVYLCPGHKRATDLDYIRHLQPPVVRILEPDPDDLRQVWAAAPSATIFPRYWWLDDGNRRQHEAMVEDPVGTAHRHAAEWRTQLQKLGVPFGNPNVVVTGVNEPSVNETEVRHAAVEYNKAFLLDLAQDNIRGGALCLPVGHPAHLHNGEPDWRDYMSLEPVIRATNGVLVLHSYWQQEGPDKPEDWGWLAGRHIKCPMQVPILIGEAGVDGGIYNRYPNNVGYRGVDPPIPPAQYADQIVWYHNHCDPRVIGICIYLSDYRDNHWSSFDLEPAYGDILARLPLLVEAQPPASFPPLPIPEPPPIRPPDILPPSSGLAPAGQWPVPGGVITGRFGETYAGAASPHNGLDIGAASGTPVLCVWDGIVKWTDFDVDYGNYARIYCPEQRVHLFYAHLRTEALVDEGETIPAGTLIGHVGSTGNSSGPHLHFECRTGYEDSYVDMTFGYSRGRANPEAILWSLGVRPDSIGAGLRSATASGAAEEPEIPF